MPLYEYACGRCTETFEDLVSSAATVPECPRCGRHDEVARVRIARITIGKPEENLHPPNIKSFTRPRRW